MAFLSSYHIAKSLLWQENASRQEGTYNISSQFCLLELNHISNQSTACNHRSGSLKRKRLLKVQNCKAIYVNVKFPLNMKSNMCFPTIIFSISLFLLCVCAQSFSHVWPFVTSWIVAHQALQPVNSLPRQRVLSWLSFPAPEDLTQRSSPCLCTYCIGRFFTIVTAWEGLFLLGLIWLAMSFLFILIQAILFYNQWEGCLSPTPLLNL